ncbi:unnamed protein product [Arabidopsis lyrata]|nr:unnamed protein product [Arabidopsis lyrata]
MTEKSVTIRVCDRENCVNQGDCYEEVLNEVEWSQEQGCEAVDVEDR